jgi:hypothetical protein
VVVEVKWSHVVFAVQAQQQLAEARVFRQLLYRRLAGLAVACCAVAAATPLLPRAALVTALALMLAVASHAAAGERRAQKRLAALFASRRPTEAHD